MFWPTVRLPSDVDASRVFFYSDPHFDHANIIRYCSRPFPDTISMNRALLDNYHRAVSASRHPATVFFLGDMAFGRGSHSPKYWLEQLLCTGDTFYYVKGSHDHGIRPGSLVPSGVTVVDGLTLLFNDYKFYLTHDPTRFLPGGWHGGWVFHGHTHSTSIRDSSAIRNNSLCFCVEATGYKPVDFASVLEITNTTKEVPQSEH